MVNELHEICGVEAGALEGLDLEALRAECIDFANALELPGAEIMLLVLAAVFGFLVPLIHRGSQNTNARNAGNPAPWKGGQIFWRSFSGLLYAAMGAYTGLTIGLFIAELVPPWFLGVVGVGLGGIAGIGGIVAGLLHGGGKAGWKVLGVVLLLLYGGALAWYGVYAFMLPGDATAAGPYQTLLNATAMGLGVVGGFTGMVAGDNDAYHPGAGWLLVPVGVGWGFLGAILGVMMHLAAWTFGKDHGDFDKSHDWAFFHVYKKGFRLAPTFGFSQGDVISADNAFHVWHEATHVLQHFLFGPIFFVSYFLWLVVGAVVGFLLVGIWVGKCVVAAYHMAYINNPWEVWEYKAPVDSSHGVHNRSGFAVIPDVAAWIVTVIYIAAGVGLFVWWAVVKAS